MISFHARKEKQYNTTRMIFSIKRFRVHYGRLLARGLIFFSIFSPISVSGMTPGSLAPAMEVPEKDVTISIKSREFSPNKISLTMGQKTRLVLKNLDSELHSFLPVGLLTNIHLNVSGNGAPQFGADGLVRVLLPTKGQTEIVFIPSRPGTYAFFCDLPGHVMQGTIVVHRNEGVVE